MTQEEKTIILRRIEGKYKKRAGVLGVLVFGSFVRGDFDQYSDIDTYVLTSRKPTYAREGYMLGGIRVDVTIDEKKEAARFLKQENHTVRRIFSHMLANGGILFEKGSALTGLQRIAKRNLGEKTKYTRSEVLMHLYSIEDFYGEVLRFYKSKDQFSFEQNLALLVNNAVECFLKIHGEYLRRPNELEAVIKKNDPTFWKLLKMIYEPKNKAGRLKAIGRFVRKIEFLARGPLPKNWRVV